MSDEETRAEEYRAMLRRRKANDRSRQAALHGSSTVRKQLSERWEAVELWLAERKQR